MAGDPWAWPEGVARHVLAEVDSTNAEAGRLAPHLTRPAWILGLRQTAGRARRGRSWADPAGNFAGTLLLHLQCSPAEAALRSFVASLALHEALAAVAGPHANLALKWPNDVLLNGGKVSGILLEGVGTKPGMLQLAVGIGVNLARVPEGIVPGSAAPVSLAGETGIAIGPEDFLTYLAAAFARWEALLVAQGFAPLRAAWLARAARIGETVTARTMTESIEGIFETIDDSGALVLRGPQGRVTVPAADVYF